MNEQEIVEAFVELLTCKPCSTMMIVSRKLKPTKYELVLKYVDPLKHFEEEKEFPMVAGQRLMYNESQCY